MKISIYCLLSMLLFSCIHTTRHGDEELSALDTVLINLNGISLKKIKYSDIFAKIEYIQTPYDSIYCIGKINKLIVLDSLLFAVDQKISRSIYVFDRNGNSKIALEKMGTAPGEYVYLKDVFIALCVIKLYTIVLMELFCMRKIN